MNETANNKSGSNSGRNEATLPNRTDIVIPDNVQQRIQAQNEVDNLSNNEEEIDDDSEEEKEIETNVKIYGYYEKVF